jgi:hypothetical protein
MIDASAEGIRIFSHPMPRGGRDLLRGHRRQLSRLELVIPGLKGERNTFERVDLVYRNYGLIVDHGLRKWVRNELFDRTGLRSDPPYAVAGALLDTLNAFRRVQRV